jgi:heme/copper-type cytochrome/quinol oxidase subunit 2
MAARFRDPVAMRHPGMPGEFVTVSRSQFDKSWSKRGWVEAKSSEAKAAVEKATRPPQVDAPPASKED